MKTDEIMKKLEDGVKEVLQSEKFKSYLNLMSKFHNYSATNSLLIMMQCPEASHVAGFQTWNKVFGRTVNRGETAIKILAPRIHKSIVDVHVIDPVSGRKQFKKGGIPVIEQKEIKNLYFNPVSVFDVSQTSGKPLPTLIDELKGSVNQFDKFYTAIKELAPVPLVNETMPAGKKGYYDGSKIAINEGMSDIQTLKTAIHELAHSRLHSKNEINEINKDKVTKEVEAEGTAYTVCKRFGIDTGEYSFAYIAGWSSSRNINQIKESIETIQREANAIILHIEKALGIGKLREQSAQTLISENDLYMQLGKKIEAGQHTPQDIERFNQLQEQRLKQSVESAKQEAPAPKTEIELSR